MNWYVLRVRGGDDIEAKNALEQAGLPVLDMFGVRRVRNRRTRSMETKIYPVFPGYLFVALMPHDFAKLDFIPTVTGVVRSRNDGNPEIVRTKDINILRGAIEREAFNEAYTSEFQIGSIVEFDMLGHQTRAIVSRIRGRDVTVKGKIGNVPFSVTRDDYHFGLAA